MKIEQMILREDFFGILKNTVCEYYTTVKEQAVYFDYQKKLKTDKLIVNQKFSFISSAPIPKGVRRYLKGEYNIRGSKFKYIIGKFAVGIVTMIPQIGCVCNAYITSGALGSNTFISPQNRSIRFFDYDNMTVDCIIKKGFSAKYFSNQINFRKKYDYDFMIPMIECGDNWFREPIMDGHPLARVTSKRDYEKSTEDAYAAISLLAKDTLEFCDSKMYTEGLVARLLQKLDESVKRKNIKYAKNIGTLIHSFMDIIKDECECFTIPTVICHGDMQTGNIWFDNNNKTWIYDWETAHRSSIWYDSSVFGYSLRRAFGWKQFLNDETFAQMLFVQNSVCDRIELKIAEKKAARLIVMLEDLLFYLDDMLELPNNWGNKIFDDFCRTLIEIFKIS